MLTLALVGEVQAAGAPGAANDVPVLTLPEANSRETGGTFALVNGWLLENVPECPAAVIPEIAAKFIEQLSLQHPGDADRLVHGEVTLQPFESQLWQVTAVRLAGPAYEAARDNFALRRVTAVAAAEWGQNEAKHAAAALARLQNDAPANYRRLRDGRMDDEEVLRLPGLNPAREAERRQNAAAATQPKAMTAQEIAGEYSRRHQQGAAAAKLRAYVAEATLRGADGVKQTVTIFKLRPDSFRLHLQAPGQPAQVLAFDGARYWRQQGPKVETLDPAALGSLRYLNEFLDPLLEPETHQFERLEDGTFEGRACYRLRVQRADASRYVAVLDQENYHQVAREDASGAVTRYSDFRDFAGLTFAHREEMKGTDGAALTFEIRRLVANPGLISAFFAAPTAEQLDLGPLEQVLAKANP